eukprot:8857258-Ditylum_brightwellii.AAC.1
MMQNLFISYYDQLNFQFNNQVWNPNTNPPFNDMIKSLLDMLLTEPVIVAQFDYEFEDSSSYNIGEIMVADSEFVVKKKASKQGKKQKLIQG